MTEFAVLLHLKRKSELKMMYEVRKNAMLKSMVPSKKFLTQWNDDKKISESLIKIDKPSELAEDTIKKERKLIRHNFDKIDYIALMIFGLLFSIFNGIYWLYYLIF